MKMIVLFVVFLVVMNVQAFMYKNTRLLLNRGLKHRPSSLVLQAEESNRAYDISTNNATGEEELCVRDEAGKVVFLTKEEKERVFLDSLQSYYYSGKNLLTDKQFDRLREDLSWEGSVLVTLNRNETLFINAVGAYARGQPLMTDGQFDELKRSLKESNSPIAVSSEPKCFLDTGLCKVTWTKDTLRTTSLYVPAAALTTALYLGLFYELPFVGRLFNPLFVLALGAYPISRIATKITDEFLFKTPLVAKGVCPSCGVENKVFFGDVFGVKGDNEESTIKCSNCKSLLTVQRNTLRVSAAKAPAGAAGKRESASEE